MLLISVACLPKAGGVCSGGLPGQNLTVRDDRGRGAGGAGVGTMNEKLDELRRRMAGELRAAGRGDEVKGRRASR